MNTCFFFCRNAATTAIDAALSQYDQATALYDNAVKSKEREGLLERALSVFKADYEGIVRSMLKTEEVCGS